MSENCKEDVNWKQFVEENHDCPEAIYRMAQTEWEKQVALEFLTNQEDRNLIKQKLAFIEKISWATFAAVAVAATGYLVQTFLLPIV